ncbi:MAG TPA: RDD family protein [Candidatus Methylacidiphilales bacterium]|jgi:uncharacterized RDD family membrane protein YckC|nr:RDD family protein [Candidatus Methylacidiphilales bacterium]
MNGITILDRANAPMGPFTRQQVAEKLQRGEVTLSSLAFVDGLAQWTPLRDVLARVDAANPPAPTLPDVPVSAPSAPTAAYSYAATMEPPAHLVYAGFWLRVAAILVDGLVFSPITLASYLFQRWAENAEKSATPQAMIGIGLLLMADGFMIIILRWLYFALMESSAWQATIGKKVLGLRVTGMDGQRIGFGRATGRYFGKFLSALILMIGFMMAGWTARKQALHDMIANTLVVKG